MKRSLYTILDCVDTHRWENDKQFCVISWCAKEHGMRCTACGIRRHGPYDEAGARHYFTYDHPNVGMTHEISPPCYAAVIQHDQVIVDFKVCTTCHRCVEGERCRSGCPAGTIVLRGLCKRKTS